MRKLLLIAALILSYTLHGYAAADNNYLWKKGADHYTQKNYDSALYYFGKIAARKPHDATIYYNLGNTYYRLNSIGMAVLNYERALKIDPDHKESKDNLALAQSRISNHIADSGDIFFVNWWKAITRPDRSTAWAIAALVTFVLIFLLLVIRHFQKPGRKTIPVQLPGLLAFVFLCLLIFAFAASKNMEEKRAAVVIQNDAPLMNGEQKGKPLALVPEGTTVKVKSQKGTWVEVTLPDGRNGWLQENLIIKI